jgi:hypothetical protein
MSVDFQAINLSINLFHEALESLKALKDLFPKGSKREQIESKLGEAEKKVALSEAQLALLLGFKLCKCTFPPQIMLSCGRVHGTEDFACPQCGAHSVSHSRQTKAITEFDPFDY